VKQLLVFSDLDGTLLDHHTYSYEESLEGISFLKQKNIPLILVSSKTYPEMKKIQVKLGLSTPFVFENGGGVAWSNPFRLELASFKVPEIQKKINFLKDLLQFPFKTILELETDELINLTGLTLEQLELARQRETSIPFIITSSDFVIDLDQVNYKLSSEGLQITKGGRFYHLTSKGIDKGTAVKKIIEFYQKKNPKEKVYSLAFGDAPNDLAMFKVVDQAYLVKNPNHHFKVDLKNLKKTEKIGPKGFTQAIKDIWASE